MNSVFNQHRKHLLALKALREGQTPAQGMETLCVRCHAPLLKQVLAKNLYVCPNCGYHFHIGAYLRLSLLLDAGSFREHYADIVSRDPNGFPGYPEKILEVQNKTGLPEAVVTATGRIDNRKIAIAVLDSRFLMGSMSAAVGEKITRLIEHATKNYQPLVIVSASGGARMQEGIFSLMQMAKISAALARFSQRGGLFISVLTDPTTGGVTASFASLGDITLAEPGALIGFAGPRVIAQTIGQTLPEGFQRAEYLEEHGFVDQIVSRRALRGVLSQLLTLHSRGGASQ